MKKRPAVPSSCTSQLHVVVVLLILLLSTLAESSSSSSPIHNYRYYTDGNTHHSAVSAGSEVKRHHHHHDLFLESPEIYVEGRYALIPVKSEHRTYPYRDHDERRSPSVRAAFDAPGVSFTIQFTNTFEVTADLTAITSGTNVTAPHRLWVYLNGKRTTLNDGEEGKGIVDTGNWSNDTVHRVTLVSGLDEDKTYELQLFKITEADVGGSFTADIPNFMTFEKFTLIGRKPKPLVSRKKMIASAEAEHKINDTPRSSSSRRLEFIGDSLTAGYCNLCHLDPQYTQIYHKESFALSWPTLLCHELDASCHTIAWSGMGLVRNCCGGNTTMPDIYPRTMLSDPNSPPWNFKRFVPQGVVINLGSNDFSAGTNPTLRAHFISAMVKLLHHVTALYGLQLQVFMACGPDMQKCHCDYILDAMNLTRGAVNTHFIDLRNVMNSTNSCCYHPDASADVVLYERALPVIKKVLKWN